MRIQKVDTIRQRADRNCSFFSFWIVDHIIFVEEITVRITRGSIVGELGYDIHVENQHCVDIYNNLMNIGSQHGMKEAGFRALYSLSCEKGIIFIEFQQN